jgi:hypothetical protein
MALVKGFSEAAELVEKASRRQADHFSESVTYSKQVTYDELWEVWQDCKEPNWDGYDALAVEQETFQNAYRLVESLPLGCPLPSSVGAEPDGHLALEWHRNSRWTLSVSISPEGTLHYAALLGAEDPRGSCPFFGDISDSLLSLIRRVSGHDRRR